jgi:hypothetical protein
MAPLTAPAIDYVSMAKAAADAYHRFDSDSLGSAMAAIWQAVCRTEPRDVIDVFRSYQIHVRLSEDDIDAGAEWRKLKPHERARWHRAFAAILRIRNPFDPEVCAGRVEQIALLCSRGYASAAILDGQWESCFGFALNHPDVPIEIGGFFFGTLDGKLANAVDKARAKGFDLEKTVAHEIAPVLSALAKALRDMARETP